MDLAKKAELEARLRQMLKESQLTEVGSTTDQETINPSAEVAVAQEPPSPRTTTGNVIRRRRGAPEKRLFKKHKHISRIDSEGKNMHGWYVRVSNKGKIVDPKFFSDKVYGGTDEALDSALQYRNDLEDKLGKPRTDRVIVSRNPFNRSHILGVRRIRKPTGSRDPEGKPKYTDAFEVTWNPAPNKVKRTTVSISAHGEDKAFQRACAIRREKEIEIYGSPIQEFPA